jgi:hypothetical protein
MTPEDYKKIAKWVALVYAPIALLIVGIFFLVQWQSKKVDATRPASVTEQTAVVPKK